MHPTQQTTARITTQWMEGSSPGTKEELLIDSNIGRFSVLTGKLVTRSGPANPPFHALRKGGRVLSL